MKFANKVFLFAFLIAISISFSVTWASRNYVKRQATTTYISKYSLLAEAMGHALNQLEANAENFMYSAGKVVVLEDYRFGLLPTERLKQLRDELGVTHIFVADAKGNFIRSTNENPKLIPNLYSFCSKYSGLIAGGVRSMGTPIIPPTPEPRPYKFLTLPNLNRTRMIEVGVRVDFIGGTLSKALQSDPNVVNLNMYAPNGASLGRFSKDEFDMAPGKMDLPDQIPGMIETKDGYQFFTKVPSTQPRCCQCEVAGITKNGEYYYVLESRISKAELNAALASIEKFFLLVAALSLLVAFVTARIVSRTLVRRLERVISGIREAKDAKSMGTQLEVTGKDEVAQLAVEFNGLLQSLNKAQTEIVDSKRQAAIIELAGQVSHDIRSPLAALEVAAGDVSQLPEDKRILIRAAVGRIRDIANSLLNKQRAQVAGAAPEAAEVASPQLLSSLIDPVVSEKRLQFGPHSRVEIELRFDASSYGLFAVVQAVEFKRLLSNLVNNAVEAFAGNIGAVSVGLAARDGHALVRVRDNGKGIPPEVLAKLGRRGETHGKVGGSGLGLYHARTSAELWGGGLELSSEAGKGTTATLVLPLAPAPEWFVPKLRLSPGKAVVILDDDASIHQVWQGRLDALKAGEQGVEAVHLSSPNEIRDWVKGEETKALQALYLFDYELLGYRETGLSLAEELALGERVVLVTSRFEEPEVLAGCRRLKARLIPKGLAGSVPMRVEAAPPAEVSGETA